jgi:molybdenum cofactor cytidylyltransferase
MKAAVVLAAGASARLGEPKQLAVVGGERLLERAVRVVREAGCSPVVVVLGAAAETIRAECDLGDARVVVNEAWGEGMGASVRAGVGAVGDAEGVAVMTCDQPAVTAEHLLVLMATGEVTASGYAGRRGVPAYFPAGMFEELMELKGDAGARELLREARVVELTGGELDVDTAEGLAEARRVFGAD